MEAVLATTVANSPEFDQALALGRIHSILSALIGYCKTRAAYLRTGCFTCELQIRSQGSAFVPPLLLNTEAKAELLRVWGRVGQTTDVLGGVLVPPLLPPVVFEPRQLRLTRAAEPFITSDAFQSPEPRVSLLSWAIVAPFAFYCAFSICYDIFLKILPIATLIFQIIFFFHFAAFALLFFFILCAAVLAAHDPPHRA